MQRQITTLRADPTVAAASNQRRQLARNLIPMQKPLNRVIALIVLLGTLFFAPTASAACATLRGSLIQYTTNGGQTYRPAPFHVVKYLQSIASPRSRDDHPRPVSATRLRC